MTRVCTICTHPQRAEIDTALVKGNESFRAIAARFSLSPPTVRRHDAEHLPPALVEAQENRDTLQSIDVMSELTSVIERVKKLSDACDEWLSDPDDPTRYSIAPRAHDVKVIYEEEITSGERTVTVRRKAPLSELLQRIEGTYTVTAIETKHADPRELLLKSYDRLQGRLELVAKLLGQIDERPVVNLHLSSEWVTIRALLVNVLTPYPEARQAVAAALMEAERTE